MASTVVRSVGFEPETGILRVTLHTGEVHHFAPATLDEYAAFLMAPSKGTHFHRVYANRLRAPVPPSPAAIALREPEPLKPIEIIQPDECCASRLAKDKRRPELTEWECPRCGVVWKKHREAEGFVWRPDACFFLLTPGHRTS